MENLDQLNILVVDDDPSMRRLLLEIITREGHQGVGAESAEEILELLPFWTFQIAFIDQHLPGMEGMILGGYLRRNNPDMTIAMVTGSTDESLRRETSTLGIGFVSKPFNISQIIELIDNHQEGESRRRMRAIDESDAHFAPPISSYAHLLKETFDLPKAPSRIESGLTDSIKRALNKMRTSRGYCEQDRVVALSGLIAATVLGIRLPKTSLGKTLEEEYDEIMEREGRRKEFDDG